MDSMLVAFFEQTPLGMRLLRMRRCTKHQIPVVSKRQAQPVRKT